MKTQHLVSIIIPCKNVDAYVKECIAHCKKLDYDNYEMILLPDKPTSGIEDVKIVPTGSVTPGKKRNTGIRHAKGEICAFIDSDAYPREDWLRNAVGYFSNPEIAAVGGGPE